MTPVQRPLGFTLLAIYLTLCRPWCVRAFFVYCCVRLLGPLTGLIGIGTIEPPEALVSLVMVGFAAVMTGAYVRHRAARLFAPPVGGVPIPAPRP